MEHLKEENQAVYLYVQIAEAISKGRSQVVNTANLVMVHTYYEIGRMIVKDEQGGAKRASYGKNVLKILSNKLVEEFAKNGVKNLLVFSPAFVAACLETIIEIGTEYQEIFEKHGGNKVQLVPSSNTHPLFINGLVQLIKERI